MHAHAVGDVLTAAHFPHVFQLHVVCIVVSQCLSVESEVLSSTCCVTSTYIFFICNVCSPLCHQCKHSSGLDPCQQQTCKGLLGNMRAIDHLEMPYRQHPGRNCIIHAGVTRADVDVQPYAFTTKSLFVGHTDYKYLRWQVIDTPGILDRPLEERNTIEMQVRHSASYLLLCTRAYKTSEVWVWVYRSGSNSRPVITHAIRQTSLLGGACTLEQATMRTQASLINPLTSFLTDPQS